MESRTWQSSVAPSNARRIWQPWAMQIPIGQWIMDIGMRNAVDPRMSKCVGFSSLLAGRALSSVYARWMD